MRTWLTTDEEVDCPGLKFCGHFGTQRCGHEKCDNSFGEAAAGGGRFRAIPDTAVNSRHGGDDTDFMKQLWPTV